MSENISNNLMANLAQLQMDGDGSSTGKTSWLHAIAKAMGTVLNKLADSMVLNANKIAAAGDKGDPGASAMLTADSQLFSMYMNAASTVLKSIGEGSSAMARKS